MLLFNKKQKAGLHLLFFIVLCLQLLLYWHKNESTPNNRKANPIVIKQTHDKLSKPTPLKKHTAIIKKDLNQATAQDFKKIRGIGKVLSSRIVKYRAYLGEFVSEKQLYEVYGLKKDIADTVIKYYPIIFFPKIEKINPNFASILELISLPYINESTGQDIAFHVASRGPLSDIKELEKIRSFPKEKMEFLKHYITLDK